MEILLGIFALLLLTVQVLMAASTFIAAVFLVNDASLSLTQAYVRALRLIVHTFVRKPIAWWRRVRTKRAREWLRKHDMAYAEYESQVELARRRRDYYASGGSPASPDCPTLADVLPGFREYEPAFKQGSQKKG